MEITKELLIDKLHTAQNNFALADEDFYMHRDALIRLLGRIAKDVAKIQIK